MSAAAAEEASDDETKGNEESSSPEWKWECLCVTLAEYQDFMETIRKSKDPDEKYLRKQIEDHVLPLLEKAEEAQQRKRQKREKELLNMQLLAGAKRSSRIAAKEEREKAEREAAEAARKKEADLAEARKEQARQQQSEQDRQSRMMTREQRIKDREHKRILHEAELERIAAEQERLERGESRSSARHLKAELEKSQRNLAELTQEDEWVFDCSGCGVYGQNLDDGSHSVACEKCNVWQHSKCLGISQDEAEKDDFHFVCGDCKRKEEEANMPKIPPLKFRISASASPSSVPPAGKKRKLEDTAPASPRKESHMALAGAQNGSSEHRPQLARPTQPAQPVQPALPTVMAQAQFYVPPSPERRPNPTAQSPLPSSSPPRVRFSPSKSMGGMGAPGPMQPMNQPRFGPSPSQHALPPMQPGPQLPPLGTFHSARPSSSHSGYGPAQHRPSMSPTQGNHDVGRLAGFQRPAAHNGSMVTPWSSFESYATSRPHSGHGGTPTMSSHYPSFSNNATPNGNHSSPPHSSHGMGMSGISPTKQSPRPMTSGSMAGAPVLPPIRKLEPSPQLMGRSSPDAPIPPPVKCMTPEQEERRQRENASFFQQSRPYPANGQPTLMSSPSMNRIPPLEPAATSQQQEPVSSPPHSNNVPRQ